MYSPDSVRLLSVGLRPRSLGGRGAGVGWRSLGEWSAEPAEHEAGFFLIRDSVDHVASRLDLTRYTIYNYLGEIRGRPALRLLRANRDTEPPVRRSRRAAAVTRPPVGERRLPAAPPTTLVFAAADQ